MKLLKFDRVVPIVSILSIALVHGQPATKTPKNTKENQKSSTTKAQNPVQEVSTMQVKDPEGRNDSDGFILIQNDSLVNILVTIGYTISSRHTDIKDVKVNSNGSKKFIIPSNAKNIAIQVERWNMFGIPLPFLKGFKIPIMPYRSELFKDAFSQVPRKCYLVFGQEKYELKHDVIPCPKE